MKRYAKKDFPVSDIRRFLRAGARVVLVELRMESATS